MIEVRDGVQYVHGRPLRSLRDMLEMIHKQALPLAVLDEAGLVVEADLEE